MRLSFLVVVTVLVACMSVTACSPQFDSCTKDSDCCSDLRCNLKSRTSGSKYCS
ncbi:hypothetical protein BDR03DRAFT_940112, partial [Suillus americanus]